MGILSDYSAYSDYSRLSAYLQQCTCRIKNKTTFALLMNKANEITMKNERSRKVLAD